MSDYAKFLRWQLGCHDRGGYGASHGDTFYCGLRNYDQPYPCPNGLPIDTRAPSDCEPWRKRLAKAKRDIEAHRRMFAVRDLAEAITIDQLKEAAGRIRTWANL